MKKRLFSLMLTLCFIFTLLPFGVQAAEVIASGTCGENLTWVLTDDGRLTISGEGEMEDYESFRTGEKTAPWIEYCDSITEVDIANGVTKIGSYAFDVCDWMTNIHLPTTILCIEAGAFEGCDSLDNVYIENLSAWCNINFADYSANPCESAEAIYVNNAIITDMDIPQGIESIGSFQFAGLESLVNVTIPDSVTKIEEWAFGFCGNLESITIPDSVSSIADNAFTNCSYLVVFGNHGSFAESFSVENDLEYIANHKFVFSKTIEPSCETEGYDLYVCETCEETERRNIVNPIGSHIFEDNTCIRCGASWILDSGVCGANLTWNVSRDGTLTISGSGEMEFDEDTSFSPWQAYSYDILSVTFEGKITNIADEAFYMHENLRNIVIPDSVTTIGEDAFLYCSGLSEVVIPEGVNSIERGAFGCCTALKEIEIPDSVIFIGEGAFGRCTNLATVTIPNQIIDIDGTAFDNTLWQDSQTGFVIVGDGVLIHHSYEESSEELQNIRFVIPDGVKYISNDFFVHEEKDYAVTASVMDYIEFPDGLIEIGTDSFYKFNGTTLRFPASVQKIGCESGRGYSVFQNSPNLTSVYFYGDVPMIGRGVFQMYSGGRSVNQIPTLYYIEGTSGWTDSDAYDPDTGTWNGYPLASFEPEPTDPTPTDPVPTEPTEPAPTEPAPTEPEPTDPKPTEPEPTDPEPTDPVDPEPVENPFTDVAESNFFYEPVLWAVDNGITSGVSATRFAPSDSCTRAQVVTFLWRAAGEPQPTSTKNPFTDVKASAYYYDAVLWAVEEGITTGLSATSFGPNSPCTRGQVVTFLHRAAGETEPESTQNPFTDVKETGFYYDAVLWAVENSITTGTSATKFSPNQTCTRGQVVTFLYRAD